MEHSAELQPHDALSCDVVAVRFRPMLQDFHFAPDEMTPRVDAHLSTGDDHPQPHRSRFADDQTSGARAPRQIRAAMSLAEGMGAPTPVTSTRGRLWISESKGSACGLRQAATDRTTGLTGKPRRASARSAAA